MPGWSLLLIAAALGDAPDAGTGLETIVRADRGPESTPSVELRGSELQEVPGTMGDPVRVVLMLPGVSTIASGVSYPIVRGSGPATTAYLIDGVQVPMLFHLFVGPSVIHPDLIRSVELHPGAPGPEYGRLLGGAVEAATAQPAGDRARATAYLDLIQAGGFASAAFPATGTGVALAARYSFAPWLISLGANAAHLALLPEQGDGERSVLAFWDYQLRIEQAVGPGTLRLFVFGSHDDSGVQGQTLADGWLVHATFHRADLRYRVPLGPGRVEVALTAGGDLLGFDGRNGSGAEDLGPLGVFDVTTVTESVDEPSWRARASWRGEPSPGVEVSFGADVDHRAATLHAHQVLRLSSTIERSGDSTFERDLDAAAAVGTFLGAWGQVSWTDLGPWKLTSGLRADRFHLVPGVDRDSFEPRFVLRRRFSPEISLRAAAGLYHQPPVALISLPVVDVGGLQFGLQEAAQASVGVEWRPWRGVEVTADAYFNPILRAVDLDVFGSRAYGFQVHGPSGGALFPEVAAVVSRGYATGLELMVRHRATDRWFGWISYSLQRSARWATYALYGASTGKPSSEGTGWVPFAFDQTHVANAVLGCSFPGGWTAGVALHLNTGRPESGQLTSRTQLPGVASSGAPLWIPADDAHVARLPPFLRLDARVSKTWSLGPLSLEAYLDVLNATASREVLSFEYSISPAAPDPYVKQPFGLPLLLPVLGVKASY